jgi:hypothetical protein
MGNLAVFARVSGIATDGSFAPSLVVVEPARRKHLALGASKDRVAACASTGGRLTVLTAAVAVALWPVAAGAVPPATVTSVEIPVTTAPFYTGTLGSFGGEIVVGDLADGATCRLALVNPTTLRVLSDRSTSCDNPLLAGENVMPVESIVPVGSQYGEVRIAVRDQANGSFRLGPVVMRYGNFSDTRPEWTYGGGYLWLYDARTQFVSTGPKLPAELLRISLATGKVLATVSGPRIDAHGNGRR